MRSERGSVIAFAGRRIDPAGAQPPRFPLDRVDAVRSTLRRLFETRNPAVIVASAACGADLIAAQLAGELGIRARIVLPFAPEDFRESSVTDRPGNWADAFDLAIARARATDDLVVLHRAGSGGPAYAAASSAILDEAIRVARERDVEPRAVVAWDGRSRGSGDLTEAFRREAVERGLVVEEISTLDAELIG